MATKPFNPIKLWLFAPLMFLVYLGTGYGFRMTELHFGWSKRPYDIGEQAVTAVVFTLFLTALQYRQLRKKEKKERSDVMSIRSGKEI